MPTNLSFERRMIRQTRCRSAAGDPGIDSRLPILGVETLQEQIRDRCARNDLITQLCTFFGLLALTMVCVGLYGTMSYSVTRRTNEIGIRMALGAQRSNVVGMFLRDSAALVASVSPLACRLAWGIAIDRSLLYGPPNFDWMATGGALALLVAIAALAAYLPARRASKIDPMVALRYG